MGDQLWSGAAAGSALEIVFGKFLETVKYVIIQNIMFKSSLQSLEEILVRLEPTIKKIDEYNKSIDKADETKKLRELIEDGRRLVTKCSTVHPWNFIKKPWYNRKLLKLTEDFKQFISFDLQVNQAVDQKEILVGMMQLTANLRQRKLVPADGLGGLEGLCSAPGLREDPIGLERPIRELKEKLLKESESASLIVIAGLGGSGKTTLAISLCHDVNVKEKFKKNIFFVPVSKRPNLMMIAQRLLQHKGYKDPCPQSPEDAVNHVEHLMRKAVEESRVLLVLDDVWPGPQSILEQLMFRIRNYNILVTSRYEFPSFGSTYKLQSLSDVDATTLFCQSAFPSEGSFYRPHPALINQIVRSCGGFPLAITVNGKSLCRKHATDWQKKADECSDASTILTHSQLLDRLQSSIDALDYKVKECFKDLGCFPEDHRIPATALVDMWMERHNLNEYQAIVNLHEIGERSLIELVVIRKIASEVDRSYSELFVEQHDLIRELAILQSKSEESIEKRERIFSEIIENKLPDWWAEQGQRLTSAKLLSMSTDATFLTSWFTIEAPKVEVLVLNFQSKNYMLPGFLDNMDKLKVLIVTNYSLFPAEIDNFPLLASLTNLKRIRFEKAIIPALIEMNKLEKLSLFMCNIAKAFSNKDVHVAAYLPNLVELYIDYCNDLVEIPKGFCDLNRLKRLIITNCQKLISLPQDIGKLANLEGLNLNSCIELVGLPDNIGGLRNLSALDISDCLSITRFPEEIGELRKLQKLCMVNCSSCKLPSSVRKLGELKEVICDEETCALWENHKSYLPNLEIKVHQDINLNWLG